MDRRSFLKTAGLTGLTPALMTRELLAEATATTDTIAPRREVAGSFPVYANQVSGIPLGGIGAGSIEIRPDGYFADWLIFNMGAWSPEQPSTEHGPSPEPGPEALQFFVRCQQTGKRPQLRRLGIREDQNDLYSLSYALPVEHISFDGKFPYATLEYHDRTLPVQITGLAFAPIIPGDSRTSGTPGFTIVFKVRNTSSKPVEVSLLGALQNPIAAGASDRRLRNMSQSGPETTSIIMETSATEGRKSCHGSMGFSVTGGRRSFIEGTYRWYLGNGGWGGSRGYGSAHYSYLHAYYRDGHLPSISTTGTAIDASIREMSDDGLDRMSLSELKSLVARVKSDVFFAEFIARIEKIDPAQLTTQQGLANLMKEVRDRLKHFGQDWGDCALESTLHLKPGEEKEVRFVLSWFFPNHFSALGPNLGHQYEHWFNTAEEVNQFLTKNHSAHREKTVTFAETMLSTNVAPEVAFAWGAQLSTLIKSSWWCKDGRFAIWEGLGCCGLHTTDITYQGSFPLIALFPDLQKGQIKMGAGYQRADGRIPHFFAPDLLHVDNGFDRVDMNPQYVMMVCRDYLWTGDKEFARANWKNVVRAMASTQKLDADGDGIPDSDTRRNTYDQWDLEGSPAYICSLWLGALQSAIRLAHDLGEATRASEWVSLLAKAEQNFVKRLWNGRYFNLWVSDKGKDECCMTDQLSGEWYTGMMGLPHSVAPDLMKTALRSIYKTNFDPDFGLRNASYPQGTKMRFKTHQNLQAAGNWTGIEYANAAFMIEQGMVDEGLAIIHSVHDRYVRSGRRWNHVECGDHYFRAMSSWTTMLALTGLRVDVPNEMITIAPQVDGLVAPWFVVGGFGVLSSSKKGLQVQVRSGNLKVRRLRLRHTGAVSVTIGGRKVAATHAVEHGWTVVDLWQARTISAGDSLRIRLS